MYVQIPYFTPKIRTDSPGQVVDPDQTPLFATPPANV